MENPVRGREDVSAYIRPSTWEKILRFIASTDEPSPYLLMDRDIIREKVSILGKGIKNAKVFYAVKANPEREVSRILGEMGTGFEIASEGELRMLASLGVGAERIITSNPIKSLKFLGEALAHGIDRFAFDTVAEIDKLSVHAPGCRVYVRLIVPNEGSEWPLSKKFGVEIDAAADLLVYAKRKGLDPMGLTFHVGSQCTNVYNWGTALDKARHVWEIAAKKGINLSVLNIGGGFPIKYIRDVVEIRTIEEKINEAIYEKFPGDIEVYMEPGRAVVGDSGVFVGKVIGKARRGDENWLYIDVGVFNGLMESVGGIKYHYILDSRGELKNWTVAGPSCDSFDVIDRGVELPEPHVGDTILIPSCGAYTVSYASEFNGFSIPKAILI